METVIKVGFPGGAQVNAQIGPHLIVSENPDATDTVEHPSPFELFLASIATCAGSYARSYCTTRNIDTDGLSLQLAFTRTPQEPQIQKMQLRLQVPAGFPDNYRQGLVKAMDLCAVKKHIVNAPEFEIIVE